MSKVIFNPKTVTYNDVSFDFSNSQSGFCMENVQYEIEDTLTPISTSGKIKAYQKVSVRAKMKRNDINSFNMWTITSGGNIKRMVSGTLSFVDGAEYHSIDNIYIISISENGETWREWGDITATFSNENMDVDDGTILIFNGIPVYNCNINITPSSVVYTPKNIPMYNGSFLTKQGYGFVRVSFSGIIPWMSCDFPEMVLIAIEDIDTETDSNGGAIPTVKNLSDFISGINFDYLNMFIESSSMTWNIESKSISVNISFVGPNQPMIGVQNASVN